MSTEAFFNRPSLPIPLDRLIADIESAEHWVGMACAWFTLDSIADALIRTDVQTKIVVLNAADLARSGGAGSRVVRKLRKAAQEQQHTEWLISVLGSGDFREGIMHHKMVTIDGKIIWTGSYNFTYQAAKNYEFLLRIDDPIVARQFDQELADLYADAPLWDKNNREADLGSNAFRCCLCGQIRPNLLMSDVDYDDPRQPDIWLASCMRCEPHKEFNGLGPSEFLCRGCLEVRPADQFGGTSPAHVGPRGYLVRERFYCTECFPDQVFEVNQ